MSFPRISGSGALILAIYMTAMKGLFDKSLYGDSFRSGVMLSSSIFLNSSTMAASLLNVASHSAVVLGALNDTYVLSILLGVGFDVMTRILQLIWWIHITTCTRISFQDLSDMDRLIGNYHTVAFLMILAIIYVYHMTIHVRALRISYSYERLRKVLTGALNNLRGIPGEGFHDHLFAYSDLGGHLLPLGLSALLLHRQHALFAAFQVLAMLMLLSHLALSRIPLNEVKDSEPLIRINEQGTITCSCDPCRRRTKRKSKESSFTFNVDDGICHLWLSSFEKLSTFLCSPRIKKLE